MDPTPLLPEIREVKEGVENHLPSLFEVCQQIGDERAARGKQYELAALLMLLVLAKLAGMKSLLGASDWMQDQGAWLREHLHLSWKRMPCANTYNEGRLYSQARRERLIWRARCKALALMSK